MKSTLGRVAEALWSVFERLESVGRAALEAEGDAQERVGEAWESEIGARQRLGDASESEIDSRERVQHALEREIGAR